MSHSRIIAGAMSGTSADGVDIALTRITGRGYDMEAKLLHHHHRPYAKELRARIFQIRSTSSTTLADLADLARDISLSYARAVNEALLATGLTAKDITAIAAHGQTLFHAPPNTIQWLDPALLAAETGCQVVSDFRRADCALGGQGAPLVPFADYILFRHPKRSRAIINIGGIANMTLIPAGAKPKDVIAFDTGPGNCISDWLMRQFDPRGPGFDKGGRRAFKGKEIFEICLPFVKNRYIRRAPPKSTDGPAMIEMFGKAAGKLSRWKPNDLLCTACELVGYSVGAAFALHVPLPEETIVSGGGICNAKIMHALRFMPEISTTDTHGLPSESKESLAFALLAAATLDNFPSSLPSVTGASRPAVLGSITPKP